MNRSVAEMRNLGRATARMLAEVDIADEETLRAVGALAAGAAAATMGMPAAAAVAARAWLLRKLRRSVFMGGSVLGRVRTVGLLDPHAGRVLLVRDAAG